MHNFFVFLKNPYLCTRKNKKLSADGGVAQPVRASDS